MQHAAIAVIERFLLLIVQLDANGLTVLEWWSGANVHQRAALRRTVVEGGGSTTDSACKAPSAVVGVRADQVSISARLNLGWAPHHDCVTITGARTQEEVKVAIGRQVPCIGIQPIEGSPVIGVVECLAIATTCDKVVVSSRLQVPAPLIVCCAGYKGRGRGIGLDRYSRQCGDCTRLYVDLCGLPDSLRRARLRQSLVDCRRGYIMALTLAW